MHSLGAALLSDGVQATVAAAEGERGEDWSISGVGDWGEGGNRRGVWLVRRGDAVACAEASSRRRCCCRRRRWQVTRQEEGLRRGRRPCRFPPTSRARSLFLTFEEIVARAHSQSLPLELFLLSSPRREDSTGTMVS